MDNWGLTDKGFRRKSYPDILDDLILKSRELFGEIWPNIAANESPITYVTNGIHTCTWLAPSLKKLYNKYLMPYWQDNIQNDATWERIKAIPDEKLWEEHNIRKQKLLEIVKDATISRLRRNGYNYEEIHKIVSGRCRSCHRF